MTSLEALALIGKISLHTHHENGNITSQQIKDSDEFKLIEQALTELERLQKKEIPMKVNGDTNDWGCKNCDSTIEYQYPRCPYCGQALNWSDEE